MSETTTNNRPRRQLSDQLDRLDEQLQRHDAVLDALSEGLNGAVADAAREGVKEAVKAAVIELLTSPDLRAALYQASAPEAEARPSAWDRLRARVRQAAARVKAAAAAVATAVAGGVRKARSTVGTLAGKAWSARPVRAAVRVLIGGAALAVVARYAAARRFGAAVTSAREVIGTGVERVGRWVRARVWRAAAA